MPASSATIDKIEDFLGQKRIAMVGISREPGSFSATLFRELCQRGYDMVPVNPNVSEVQGRRCFARMQDVQPPSGAALLMTSPGVTDAVVDDCFRSGIRRIWMHWATGQGSVSDKAVQFCEKQNIDVIPGECPYMFLPNAGVVHRLHGWIRRMTGHYPRCADGVRTSQ